MTRPMSAQIWNDHFHPRSTSTKVISGGVMAEPKPTPENMKPFAMPRSAVGIQAATSRLEAGNTTACPTPTSDCTTIMISSVTGRLAGTKAVSDVPTHQMSTPIGMTIRGPNRSASRPPGA